MAVAPLRQFDVDVGSGFRFTTPLRRFCGHFLNIIFVEIEFFRDLLLRQVEFPKTLQSYDLANGQFHG